MTRAPAAEGYILVYVLVVLALLILGVLVWAAIDEGGLEADAAAVGLVCALVAAWGLAFEARRDVEDLIRVGIVAGLGVAIFAVVYMVIVGGASRGSLLVAAAGGGAALLLGLVLLRRRGRPESPHFPDLLRRSFAEEEIVERDGVQAVVEVVPGAGTIPHELHVHLQSCVAAERRVRLRFHAARGRLRVVPRWDVELGPAEVHRLVVPVRTDSRPGKYRIALDWTAKGGGGTRLRPWRAATLEHRIGGWHALLLLPFGVPVWGGGHPVHLPLHPAGLGEESLPEPQVEVVWRPDFGTVAANG